MRRVGSSAVVISLPVMAPPMRTMVRPKNSDGDGQQEEEHEEVLAPLLAVPVACRAGGGRRRP